MGPRRVRLFCNPPGSGVEEFGFAEAQEIQPTFSLDLAEDLCGACEYKVRGGKFSNCLSLGMHFLPIEGEEDLMDDADLDDEPLEVFWVGLKGQPTEWKREAVECVYETRANPADHETAKEDKP